MAIKTITVTSDSINNTLALRMADIGFAMGIINTKVAKEVAAIILMDDNFASIIKGISWGHFQLIVNIMAMVLIVISIVSSNKEESVLNAAICQLGITLILYFASTLLLGYDQNNKDLLKSLNTLIFNMFVWLQIFNKLNNHRLDNRLNVLIIFIGSDAFKIYPLNGKEWGLSIGLGVILVSWGTLIYKFPDPWAAAFIPNIKIHILMSWHKRRQKAEGNNIKDATSIASRDPSTKGPGAKVIDSINGEVEFETLLRTLTSLHGK
ncbi:hypothetical protein B0T25DRAFT_592231 [Lasiosphaeria hispida]|uniref:Uncharacterized protein n=1 Tax=Lasiosphaeria hispida TaxID=260671 RepID=A0AAJ0HGQ3_9PEZI|nr:hypothetical protein B0T25DRAFT_592231 [Lasiosphaeria hispida]